MRLGFKKTDLIVFVVIAAIAGAVTWFTTNSDEFITNAANFTFVMGILYLVIASFAGMKSGGIAGRIAYSSYKRNFVSDENRAEPMSLLEFLEEKRSQKARFLPYLIIGAPVMGLSLLLTFLHMQ